MFYELASFRLLFPSIANLLGPSTANYTRDCIYAHILLILFVMRLQFCFILIPRLLFLSTAEDMGYHRGVGGDRDLKVYINQILSPLWNLLITKPSTRTKSNQTIYSS